MGSVKSQNIFLSELMDFYRGRRVLITGDTGFKGSWLAILLQKFGAKVFGISDSVIGEMSHYGYCGLERQYKSFRVDIRNRQNVLQVFNDVKPQIVFHLAAQSLVRESYANPTNTFSTNVAGTANILDAVRVSPFVESVINVTSDKCYKNREWPWGYRENDELGGRDPYSASKACAELVFESFARSYFDERPTLGAVSVRAGNVIGGGDFAVDRIVPDCIRAFADGKPVQLRSPLSTRPWQHVLEPLLGYLEVGASSAKTPSNYNGAWNFGPSESSIKTVQDVANELSNSWSGSNVHSAVDHKAPYEAKVLHLSIEKAVSRLNWRPRWAFEETMKQTASWYKSVILERKDALKTSISQIELYLESLHD